MQTVGEWLSERQRSEYNGRNRTYNSKCDFYTTTSTDMPTSTAFNNIDNNEYGLVSANHAAPFLN